MLFSSLGQPAKMRLWIGIGVILALTIAVLWWMFTPRQQLLFGNLREGDAAEIAQSLNEWKVAHRFVDGGKGITVPADLVYETRMRLVSAGVPRGGHVGFELFDDADFGVTEFAQRVNYQRALQGEIERTIASLPGVDTARVHLTIRRPDLFVGEREGSKASVALTLRQGELLTRQQVAGIRSLVAAAVEGLSSEQVSVLDSSGALLAGTKNISGYSGLSERDDEESRLEERVRARVSELLTRVLGHEQFHVSVDAVLNFDSVHQVSERPLPQKANIVASKVRKREDAADGMEVHEQVQEEQKEAITLSPGTAREEVSRAPGRIERLSVAVALPPSVDELETERIQSLVTAAAGIDASRGDHLEVSRIGRYEQWKVVNSDPVPVEQIAAPAKHAAARIPSFAPGWMWLVMAVLGCLVGTIAGIALQQRPRTLEPAEREAVLGKLRGWLADGEPLS